MKLVYVLDDCQEQHLIIESILKKIGCTIVSFTTVNDFVSALKSSAPDLCLIDNDLGNQQKIEGALISQVIKKSARYKCKVAIISGYRSLDFMKECYKSAIDDYFTKPIDKPLFLEKVSYLLGLKEAVRPLPIRAANNDTQLILSHELKLLKISEEEIEVLSSLSVVQGTEIVMSQKSILEKIIEKYQTTFKVARCTSSKNKLDYHLFLKPIVDHTKEVDFARDVRRLIMELKYKYEKSQQPT